MNDSAETMTQKVHLFINDHLNNVVADGYQKNILNNQSTIPGIIICVWLMFNKMNTLDTYVIDVHS